MQIIKQKLTVPVLSLSTVNIWLLFAVFKLQIINKMHKDFIRFNSEI